MKRIVVKKLDGTLETYPRTDGGSFEANVSADGTLTIDELQNAPPVVYLPTEYEKATVHPV